MKQTFPSWDKFYFQLHHVPDISITNYNTALPAKYAPCNTSTRLLPASCPLRPTWTRWSPNWDWVAYGSAPLPKRPANKGKKIQWRLAVCFQTSTPPWRKYLSCHLFFFTQYDSTLYISRQHTKLSLWLLDLENNCLSLPVTQLMCWSSFYIDFQNTHVLKHVVTHNKA